MDLKIMNNFPTKTKDKFSIPSFNESTIYTVTHFSVRNFNTNYLTLDELLNDRTHNATIEENIKYSTVDGNEILVHIKETNGYTPIRNCMKQPRFKVGEYVYYQSHEDSKIEKGRIKRLDENDENFIFVVFNCAGEWDNYMDYTAQRTSIDKIIEYNE